MTKNSPIKLGIMGFGQTGRQIYELASHSEDIEVVAIADIGEPDILHYLLQADVNAPERHRLQGNFLVNPRFRSRLMQIDLPREMPWDIFEVDAIIDSTGKYREVSYMEDHLTNGARRVVLRTLPVDGIDRIVIPGVNESTAQSGDTMISGGSATTSALCLLLNILSQSFAIECGSMNSVHAYTSDQALQDYAGTDIRRSRSAAKNIIPNTHEAGAWLGQILPQFENKILTSALNVPIHEGCLLDLSVVMTDPEVGPDDINGAMRSGVQNLKGIADVVDDPIVSSDVIGSSLSLLFDTKGTIKAGENTIKMLGWYENLGHAARLLDVVRVYRDLDQQQEAA